MESARPDDLLERVHRRLVAEVREVPVQVVLELIATSARRARRVERVDHHGRHRIDHLGAQIAELTERAAKHLVDFTVERRRVVRLVQDAEAGPLQAVLPQRRGVVGTHMPAARRSDGIVRIVARNRLQHARRVGNRPRHCARDVRGEIERHDAGAAHQAHRRPEPDERLMSSRPANGVAGIARERDGAEVRGRGGRRSAARSGGDACRMGCACSRGGSSSPFPPG